MSIVSAGLLMYSLREGKLLLFLVHPGGPFFKNKHEGWWTIPKGLPEPGEELLEAAKREFHEETGISVIPPLLDLGSIKQKGGKTVFCWGFKGSWNSEEGIKCNNFLLEWPPKSGKKISYPEVDKAEWIEYEKALRWINEKQQPFIFRLREIIQINE